MERSFRISASIDHGMCVVSGPHADDASLSGPCGGDRAEQVEGNGRIVPPMPPPIPSEPSVASQPFHGLHREGTRGPLNARAWDEGYGGIGDPETICPCAG